MALPAGISLAAPQNSTPPKRHWRTRVAVWAHRIGSKMKSTLRQDKSRSWAIDPKKTGFLDLPAEIRNDIYRLALTSKHQLHPYPYEDEQFRGFLWGQTAGTVWYKAFYGLSPNILLAAKSINAEATPVLYGDNEFLFGERVYMGMWRFARQIGSSAEYVQIINLSDNWEYCVNNVHPLTDLRFFPGLRRIFLGYRPSRMHCPLREAELLLPLAKALANPHWRLEDLLDFWVQNWEQDRDRFEMAGIEKQADASAAALKFSNEVHEALARLLTPSGAN